MKTLSTLLLLVAAAAVVWIALPGSSDAQCAVTNTASNPGPTSVFVTKTLSATATCQNTAINALSCFPGGVATGVTKLSAFALTATTNPYCNWTCSCGTGTFQVVTDGTDGLPVELMDFAIDDGSDA